MIMVKKRVKNMALPQNKNCDIFSQDQIRASLSNRVKLQLGEMKLQTKL
jgi:hypothetical protein